MPWLALHSIMFGFHKNDPSSVKLLWRLFRFLYAPKSRNLSMYDLLYCIFLSCLERERALIEQSKFAGRASALPDERVRCFVFFFRCFVYFPFGRHKALMTASGLTSQTRLSLRWTCSFNCQAMAALMLRAEKSHGTVEGQHLWQPGSGSVGP